VRKRGVEDFSLAMLDPWATGYDTECAPGRRLIKPLTFIRSAPDDNGYARPVEGLIVVVDLDLEVNTATPIDHCGSCTACIDACPTGAIIGAQRLDARRCISYLTIEWRGPIPRELRTGIGAHLFGCDICQVVCPWNRKAPLTRAFAYLGRPEIVSLGADTLLTLDEEDLRTRLQLSPVQRPQRTSLLRNAAVVLGNTGDRRWVTLLSERLVREPEPLVRGHIAWALGALGGSAATRALTDGWVTEPDVYVQEEIRQALASC